MSPSSIAVRWRLAAAMALGLLSTCASASAWPRVALPAQAQVHAVDSVIVIDGLPVRMQGFVTPLARAEAAAWFRHSLGAPLVENRLGPKLVIGKARGDYFVSVQLEALENGTRAVVAVAHLAGAIAQRPALEAANQRLLLRMPGGTRVLSRLAAVDGPRSASHVILSNGHDTRLNSDQLVRMLHADGMQLEHQAEGLQGRTLLFKGQHGEAMAVVARQRDGLTHIVLNVTTYREASQ